MMLEELPKYLKQDVVDAMLESGLMNVEINKALCKSDDVYEFQRILRDRMIELISQCRDVVGNVCEK
ncbi:hypothetical protein ACFL5V_08860 [Fibrobacterota bacterium]